jgi:hypothetical protein
MWVLWLWLASSPADMTPLGWYVTSEACFAARKADVQSQPPVGGGVRYECLFDAAEPRASTAMRGT